MIRQPLFDRFAKYLAFEGLFEVGGTAVDGLDLLRNA
jgi:hypothetical protein